MKTVKILVAALWPVTIQAIVAPQDQAAEPSIYSPFQIFRKKESTAHSICVLEITKKTHPIDSILAESLYHAQDIHLNFSFVHCGTIDASRSDTCEQT